MSGVKSEIIRLNENKKTNKKEKVKSRQKANKIDLGIQNDETENPKMEKGIISGTTEIQPIPGIEGTQELQIMKGIQVTPQMQEVQVMQGQSIIPFAQIPNSQNIQQQVIPYAVPVMVDNVQGQVLPPVQFLQEQTPSDPPKPKYGFMPMLIICPYCQGNIMTKTEEIFSRPTCLKCVASILCYILFLPIIAFFHCYPSGRKGCNCSCFGEDCNCKCCYDVNHYCSNCGKLIGTRISEDELCPKN